MQYEAPVLKSADSTRNPNGNENLAAQNQDHEIYKPANIKEANATATTKLEDSGELPTVSLDSQTNSLAAKATTSDTQAVTGSSSITADDLKQLTSVIDGLKKDEQALAKDPTSAQDLSKVNADEGSLHIGELNFMHAAADSTAFADYSQTMAGQHAELKSVAESLWKMGQKTDAAETTAYFPTSHYEKYFDKSTGTSPTQPTEPTQPTDPSEPGGPALKDETSYANMQNNTWNKNLIASQIGGKGINPDMQLSDSDNKLTATMSGGSYTDGLVSNTQKLNTSDNTVQLNYDVTVKPGSDLHCLETDAAITTGTQANGKTLTAMAAGQFVMNPTNGTMEFDTSGTNHGWIDAVNDIPMPKDGTNMDVSMTVKLVGDTYQYTGLTVDGKSYAINPSVGDFTMTTLGTKGWTPNTIHTQLQQDLGSAGGSSTVTYNDIQVNQGNT